MSTHHGYAAIRTHTVTVTKRGQVTLPAPVKRLLGVEPRDRVVFQINHKGEVRIQPSEFTLESAFASVTPLPGIDVEEASRIAKLEKATQIYSS